MYHSGSHPKIPSQVSMYHYLRKSSRWASKKSRPPEVYFLKKQKKDESTILQSWFKKSLDSCVLGGDTECQVPQSCFDLFPPENSFLLLSTNIEGRTIIYSFVEICLLLVLLSQILCHYFGFFIFPQVGFGFQELQLSYFCGSSRYFLYLDQNI